MHSIFQNNLDFVYFIYGAAFFFTGLAILIQSHNDSEIELSSAIPWLGLFGILHGLNEWWDMWQIIKELSELFQKASPFILLISYIPLFEFGRRTLALYSQKKGCQFWPTSLLRLWVYPVLGALIFLGGVSTPEFANGITIFSRYIFGLLGALLTGVAFICTLRIYRTQIANLGSGIPFYMTGAAFFLYAPLGGLFGPEADFFPASAVNANSFLLTMHVPVQIFRAACAVAVLIGISCILRLFRIETFQKLKQEEEEIVQLNAELEQRVKERTAQLVAANRELKMEIAERKRTAERLHYLAYYDELTGLPNRALFRDHLQQVMTRAKRSGLKLGVMFLDIERLKSVNDSLGHQAGDSLIRETGRRIRQAVRESDTVARIAGGEFMVVAEDIECSTTIVHLGNRIRETMNQSYELLGTQIYPDCSIGFSIYPDNSTEMDILLKQTDMAMYEAKCSFFAKVQGFAGQEDWITQQFYLEHELKGALDRGEFLLYYQPQIDLHSGQIFGVEALLRWDHPVKGLVPPGDFIPMLEKTGIISHVGQWVIHQACRQVAKWQKQGNQVTVGVNISAQQLEEDQLIRSIRESLKHTGIDAKYLEVELTETVLMRHVARAAIILQTLSNWGIKVALDDFGKGYSSLSYLQQLALDTIKLDKQFVLSLPGSTQDMVLVQTIVNMAHNLGKKVLAEGVEREDQVQALRDIGCDYAQGFLFGRPMPAQRIDFSLVL